MYSTLKLFISNNFGRISNYFNGLSINGSCENQNVFTLTFEYLYINKNALSVKIKHKIVYLSTIRLTASMLVDSYLRVHKSGVICVF